MARSTAPEVNQDLYVKTRQYFDVWGHGDDGKENFACYYAECNECLWRSVPKDACYDAEYAGHMHIWDNHASLID